MWRFKSFRFHPFVKGCEMYFKRDGSFAWYVGWLLCSVGLAIMFEKDEIERIRVLFAQITKGCK